ncbi:MAG: hypothetical protein HC905_09000 [Bacteroidales bacterium]|nr:hypothetical protein [Bacteroidales bacterium]
MNGGFSLVGTIISAANGQTSSIPAIQVTYDYGISDFFSLGAAVSHQGMKIDYTDINYGDYRTKINRLNVAARALFHYGNSGKIDMYSGLRLGYTNWGVSTNSKDPDYVADDVVKGGGFAPQVILFGFRGYFSEHIGLNSELAVGAPHYFSIGLNFRF